LNQFTKSKSKTLAQTSNASKLEKNYMYAFLVMKQAAIITKENPKIQRISKLGKGFYTSF